MSSVLANWKTSLAGVVLIAVGILSAFFDVHFPGFTMDSGAAITMGLGLLVAKDAGVAVKAAIIIAFATAAMLGAPRMAMASDNLSTKALPNPFAGGYDLIKCGAYYGVNSLGSAGQVEGTNVTPGTQVVQGGIGATIGYGCPISVSNQSFWFAEGLFDFTNLNGNSNGLALSGPATFVQRFGVGSPLNQMANIIPGLASNSSSPAMPSLPILPAGVTAGPGAPYLFAAIHEQDVSAQFGLAQNRQWLISAGFGAGLRFRLSNGVVADTFAEYKLATNSVCLGPLGSSGCAKIGPAALVGVQFLY